MAIANLPRTYIQPDDRLLIRVSAFDPETAEPFNQNLIMGNRQGGGNSNNGGGNQGNSNINQAMIGNLVDNNGNIEFPVIGTIQLAGLSLETAKTKMYDLLDPYLTNYSVDIQILNRRITVSGEVNDPGVVQLDRNKISLIEAIERAGGLTTYSNRTNVLVIREIEEGRQYARLNLKDRSIVDSPYYYVMPNDVIYLEPVKQKTFTTQEGFFRGLAIFTSLISTVAIIVAFTR